MQFKVCISVKLWFFHFRIWKKITIDCLQKKPHLFRETALWAVLMTVVGAKRLAVDISFTSVFLFINNSGMNRDVGAINGLASSSVAVARSVTMWAVGYRGFWKFCIYHPLQLWFSVTNSCSASLLPHKIGYTEISLMQNYNMASPKQKKIDSLPAFIYLTCFGKRN